MINLVQARKYRNDIQGLRAIAVLVVIIFHFGYLPNGYLGVDVFFVISGFLITSIIYKQIIDDRFTIRDFYIRRIRRILPLALFIVLISLIVGIVTMLPDDLENLAESVVATNFFSNNILQAITTKDYWDVVNEYKPLMHTWSLGVEEQYYLVYPLLLVLVTKRKPAWTLSVVSIFAVVSLILYLMPHYEYYEKFYLIFFRFWELAAGGMTALALRGKLIENRYSALFILSLILLLCIDIPFIPKEYATIMAVLITVVILSSSNERNTTSSFLLENPLFVGIGIISFSLYMWHQVLLAYARYFWVQELGTIHLFIILLLTIILSILSYYFIEQPFRNKNKINTKTLLQLVGFIFILTTSVSLYLYFKAGVLKDIPELGIRKSEVVRNLHAEYNAKIYTYDKNFNSADKIKVLVIGNSFARDWVNVLLESKFASDLEISYIYDPGKNKNFKDRVKQANIIFYATPDLDHVRNFRIPENKLWVIGTKNFGTSNGIFYNRKGDNYYAQRTLMENGYLEKNQLSQKEWGDRYINLIRKIIDANQTVPVFTPSRQFISQDCRHFTKAGAQYFAFLLEDKLASIFNIKN